MLGFRNKPKEAYKTTLTDIFSNKIIFTNTYYEPLPINTLLRITFQPNDYCYIYISSAYIYLTNIERKEPSLMAYMDKQVPQYILIQLYYKLNKITNTPNKTTFKRK